MNASDDTPTTGNMSVRVTLTAYALKSSATRQAAEFAFGPKVKEFFHCTRDSQVICRPDQFVIFMFERNRLGGCNAVKDLSITLINPPAFMKPQIDVTGETYAVAA